MDACSVLISYFLVIRILDHVQILCSNQNPVYRVQRGSFFCWNHIITTNAARRDLVIAYLQYGSLLG